MADGAESERLFFNCIHRDYYEEDEDTVLFLEDLRGRSSRQAIYFRETLR